MFSCWRFYYYFALISGARDAAPWLGKQYLKFIFFVLRKILYESVTPGVKIWKYPHSWIVIAVIFFNLDYLLPHDETAFGKGLKLINSLRSYIIIDELLL